MSLLKKSLIAPSLALLLASSLYAKDKFNISTTNLNDAIQQISETAKIPYIVDMNILKNKSANKVEDVESLEEALKILLKDTGLEAIIQNNTIVIREKKLSNTGNNLGSVNILATAKDGASEQGYLSKDISGIGLWESRSLQDTPYQMSVISKEMIENTGGNIEQVFRMNPVVQLFSTSKVGISHGINEINIRGFDAGSNMILDGIPLSANTALGQDFERIEILNGLSGFLYGVGNVGGSVNYVLKRPTSERLTNLTLGSTSDQAYYGHLDISDKIDEDGKFSYRLNAFYQNGKTNIKDQKLNNKLISGALDWKVSDNLLLQFDASHKKIRTDKTITSLGTTKSASYFDPKEGYSPKWGYNEDTLDKYGLKTSWHLNDNIKVRASYTYLEEEMDEAAAYPNDNYDGTFDASYYRYPWEGKTQGAYLYTDFDFSTFKAEHTLTLGASGVKTKNYIVVDGYEWTSIGSYSLRDLNNIPSPVIKDISNNQRYLSKVDETVNLMIGDDIRFNENWSALVGLNYVKTKSDSYNESGDNTGGYDANDITPSLSLIYKPFEDLTTYVTYMEALEDGTTVSDTYANAGEIFDPYISKQYELGAKYSINENLLLSSALFRIEKANSYEEATIPQPTLTQDGLVINEGLELTVTGKITDNLTLVAGGTIMDLKIDKGKTWNGDSINGKKPINTASKMAKIYAEYSIASLKGLTVTGGAYYTGKSYRDNANTDIMPSYTIYDAGVRYRTKIDKYPTTFLVNLTNLTNERYWSSNAILGEPRSVAFSMKMEF